MVRWTAALLCALVAGCAARPEARAPGAASVDSVVNKLKAELALFANTPPARPSSKGGLCTGVNGQPIVSAVATSASLVLKVTVSNSYAANAGAKIPAGTIVTVDPAFSGSYQTNGTQAVTLDLDLGHAMSDAELRTELEGYDKTADFYAAAAKRTARSDPTTSARFTEALADVRAHADQAYASLARSLSNPGAAPPYLRSSGIPASLDGHDLAATLWTVRQGLLNVDHTIQPCVKPHQLKTEIGFEVVADQKASLGIDIYIVSIGASVDAKRDSVQSVTVTFDMTGGKSTLLFD